MATSAVAAAKVAKGVDSTFDTLKKLIRTFTEEGVGENGTANVDHAKMKRLISQLMREIHADEARKAKSKQQWSGISTERPSDEYAFVINADNSLVTELNSTGWSIRLNRTALDEWKKKLAVYVGVIGPFNTGKTWLLMKQTGRELESGFTAETKGISGLFPTSGNERLVYLDSAGSRRSLPYRRLLERHLTDQFIEDLILTICEVIVVVVPELDTSLMHKIAKLETRVYEEFALSKPQKQLVVVHNWRDIETAEDAEQKIHEHIVTPFEAQRASFGGNMPNHEYFFHKRKGGEEQVLSFVIARDGSEAGRKWNNNTFDLLKNFFAASKADKSADVLATVAEVLPRVLADYVQPFEEPINERNESFALRALSWPRRAIRHVLSMGSKVGQHFLAVPEPSADLKPTSPYAVVQKNNALVLEQPRPLHFWPTPGSGKQFQPDATLFDENGKEWCVSMDLPGLNKTKLTNSAKMTTFGATWIVDARRNQLVVQGMRPRPYKMTKDTYNVEHLRGHGRFSQFREKVDLPSGLNLGQGPKVEISDGVAWWCFDWLADVPEEL